MYKVSRDELQINCTDMAKFLLGKLLVRRLEDGNTSKGRIVETECYLGLEDKAAHSYGGRITSRTEAMFMPAGTVYVYPIYGMYYCFNISSTEPGAAVLIRALEPITGLEYMEKFRTSKKDRISSIKTKDLCNGPSKLCISMDINKNNCNKLDLGSNSNLWLEHDPDFNNEFKIVNSVRIGIGAAGEEWVHKPLRFYILGNVCVSKRDKKVEKEMLLDNS